CDRVGIIDEGVLVAEGTWRELVQSIGGEDVVRMEASGDLEAAAEAVRALDGVKGVNLQSEGMQVVTTGASRLLPRLVQTVDAQGVELTHVEVLEPDLESVFLHLTGKALRD